MSGLKSWGAGHWWLRAATRLVGVALLLALLHPLAAAPPHLISLPHSYDPDWPVVQAALTTKCLGCHRSGTERTDLTHYEAVISAEVEGDPLVVPFEPDASLLWEYLSWNAAADPHSSAPDTPMMPPEQADWLTVGQLRAVHNWIANGARQYACDDACGAQLVTEIDFPAAKVCAQCHPKQFDEWSSSMHAYAMHSPVFEAFNLTLLERTSGTIGTFCTRCHSPIGTALGETGSRRMVNRSRLSLEGITCVVCHRRATGHHKNNGRVPVEPGELHQACMYGPFESSFGTQVGGHGSQRLPYLKSSQFCGECHDVVTPTGVRNEEAFSEWQRSPAARAGITCQQCHMGPVQGVPIADCDRPLGYAATVPGVEEGTFPLRRLTDHSFAGPDYSLLPDTEFPHKLDWMYEIDYRHAAALTPHQQATLRNLRLRNRRALEHADGKRLELLRNAARLSVGYPERARPSSKVAIRVDVESIFGGHNFPTGFSAERQLWIAIEVRDPSGQLIFRSGDLDSNLDLRDDHSHDVLARHVPYDRHLLNFQNKFTALTNRGTERSVTLPINRHLMPVNILRPATGIAASFGRAPDFRIAKGSLPPLEKIGQKYPVVLPDEAGLCSICVRLNFRHLPAGLLDHVGTPHLKHLLEIVVIDEFFGTLRVCEDARQASPLRLFPGRR